MSTAEEATINPDGSTSFPSDHAQQEQPPIASPADEAPPDFGEEGIKADATPAGIDPAIYLLLGVAVMAILFYFFVHRKKAKQTDDNFFLELDGDKIREKCLQQGWVPGTPMSPDAAANPQQISGPQRVLAQALMKRAIADIPIVQHIQKEAAGMNKLYAQSMCSVQQWKAFQNAEAMVASEIDSVRAEADALDPGWSQYVWKQAMQYHQALKQKNEQEEKKKQELAEQRKIVEAKVAAAKKQQTKEEQELNAQKVADELLKAEERDKESKKAFSTKSATMKKGFLDNGGGAKASGTKGKKKK